MAGPPRERDYTPAGRLGALSPSAGRPPREKRRGPGIARKESPNTYQIGTSAKAIRRQGTAKSRPSSLASQYRKLAALPELSTLSATYPYPALLPLHTTLPLRLRTTSETPGSKRRLHAGPHPPLPNSTPVLLITTPHLTSPNPITQNTRSPTHAIHSPRLNEVALIRKYIRR